MPLKAINPTKPVLGYTLKQRIGSGGYGEVWAAEAPGGLPKAVKFIFGFHDDSRAQTELKALNRIRAVRHPFLLSLERIDVVDGQMVVITELADMCLKTRFQQCVESGLKGIPRSELLGYLRDAASALDFISTEFKLQHLDVKPENLLLVSGHVKVADFGLVKDIHDGTQSMMSGLTPAYAPPELFDGKPNKASDQYSLAIVFQEMLSGTRPFDGRTAAQLAAQHLKERPNLRPLPREDQSIISRALSKDPEVRFPTCSQLIDALAMDRTTQAAAPRTRTKLRQGKRRRDPRSDISTLTLASGTRPFAISPTETTSLPTVDYDATKAKCRPTLFLGVGKTGTNVVRQLRRRLNERNGAADKLPAIKLLCIDADSDDLATCCHTGTDSSLSSHEVFRVPLRRPEDYREDANMHLAWLSRRWIYNVPKSLQTEGIRPLGRLALATHVDELAIRLRQVLSDLVRPEQLAETASTLELEPQEDPRVVIVGSVSGGTCSGMGIDLAYITRAILRELGKTTQDVIGMFTHSATFSEQQRELPIANTLAFLNELYHFSCVEEFPGDESCGIPPSLDGTTTFASTYLVHLGDDLDQDTYDSNIDSIAEYLYLSSATVCATYFDMCRRTETETSGLPLRTVGLYRSGEGRVDLVAQAAQRLGEQVLSQWTTELTLDSFDPSSPAAEFLQLQNADVEGMRGLVHETITHVMKDPVASISQSLLEAYEAGEVGDREETAQRVWQTADDIFGFERVPETPSRLTEAANALCEHFAQARVPELIEFITKVIDAPGPRLAGASKTAAEIERRLDSQQYQLRAYIDDCAREIDQTCRSLASPGSKVNRQPLEFFTPLAELLLTRFSLETILRLTESLQPAVASSNEIIEELHTKFEYIIQQQDSSASQHADESESPSGLVQQRITDMLKELFSKLAQRVEQHLHHNMLDQQGGLRQILDDPRRIDEFLTEFDEAKRATIVEQLKELPADAMFGDELTPTELAQWMAEFANPRLTCCGGALRLMHAYPSRTNPADQLVKDISAETGHQPSLIPATVGELVSCIEAESVPLDNVAMHLLKDRPDSIEFASRLHTRVDISWTHISSMR